MDSEKTTQLEQNISEVSNQIQSFSKKWEEVRSDNTPLAHPILSQTQSKEWQNFWNIDTSIDLPNHFWANTQQASAISNQNIPAESKKSKRINRRFLSEDETEKEPDKATEIRNRRSYPKDSKLSQNADSNAIASTLDTPITPFFVNNSNLSSSDSILTDHSSDILEAPSEKALSINEWDSERKMTSEETPTLSAWKIILGLLLIIIVFGFAWKMLYS